MARICWIQHGAEHRWAVHMADRWRDHGIETAFVATMREGHDAYLAAGHPSTLIADVAFDDAVPVDRAELERIDATYGPPLLRSIVRSDVHLGLLHGADLERSLKAVARAIGFWERYLDAHDVDVLLVRETQSFATRSAYVVASLRGRPRLVRPDIGPSDEWFALSDVGEHAASSALLRALAAGPRRLTETERVRVDELVRARVPLHAERAALRDPGVAAPLLPLHLIRERVREEAAARRHDPVAVAGHRLRRRFLRQRSAARRTRRRFPYDDVPRVPFVYFPLPFRDEGMVLANHGYWAGHLHDLVAATAASLPTGVELVVKEHPGVPGDQSLSDLRALQRLDRVSVVRPETAGLSLVRQASAVFTLGGTAGWEAFLCRRPVVVFAAAPYYARSPLVDRVEDVDRVESALADAIRGGAARYDDRDDEWAWFVHCFIETSAPGRFFRFEFPFFTDENLLAVADEMAARIAAIGGAVESAS